MQKKKNCLDNMKSIHKLDISTLSIIGKIQITGYYEFICEIEKQKKAKNEIKKSYYGNN